MGHLLSRALRRLIQASQSSRDQTQPPEQQDNSENKSNREAKRAPTAELIPVGQSIDSAEYATFELADSGNPANGGAQLAGEPPLAASQQVEEAAVKIQAFVRGHLTRKALKEANQPNLALGQSQFEPESLTRGPPSAVFLATSPLSLALEEQSKAGAASPQTPRTPLESIEELAETTQPTKDQAPDNLATKEDYRPIESCSENGVQREEQQQQEREERQTEDSAAAAACEESHASIELDCESPGSASAELELAGQEANKAAHQLCSVLHAEQRALVGQVSSGSVGQTPEPLESEAAAIRIQSAFRGYRTRKNSPYRTRSPNSTLANKRELSNERQASANGGGGQAAVEIAGEQVELMADCEQEEANELVKLEGRRSSRPRTREALDADSSAETPTSGQLVAVAPDAAEQAAEQDSLSQLGGRQPTSELSLQDDQESTLNEIGAALETVGTIEEQQGEELVRLSSSSARPSIGTKSEHSMDTDSSALGAALSLSEDVSSAQTDAQTIQAQTQKEPAKSRQEQEDKLLGVSLMSDELELEAQRLVEELDREEMIGQLVAEARHDEGGALDEGPSESLEGAEIAKEAEVGGVRVELGEEESLVVLNEEEQRAIELESDHIERRDPRGQVSEERAKSPQIRMEPPKFGAELEEAEPSERLEEEQQDQLSVGAWREPASASGRSSPALNSSSNEEPENSELEGEEPEEGGQGERQVQTRQRTASRNRRRNNRNKKRGKK